MNLIQKLRDTSVKLFNSLSQTEAQHNPEKIITPGMPELLRSAAAQTAVLLENRTLPLAAGTKVSVFGRVQIDWFATGYGSGGDVNKPYVVNLLEGLRNCDSIQVNEAIAETYERFFIQADACLTHDAYDCLQKLRLPTLVIGGEKDQALGGDASREIASQIPGAELKMYAQWGHGLYEEAKDFNRTILEYLT